MKKLKSKSKPTETLAVSKEVNPLESCLNPEWPVHEAAQIFPEMSYGDLEKLTEDISTNGQLEPVLILNGHLLDGRARVHACKVLGKPVVYKSLQSTLDALALAVSFNLRRRHLDTREKTLAAGKVARLKRGDVKTQRDESPDEDKLSIQQAADCFKVSRSGVRRAKSVYDSGNLDLIEKVEKREISLQDGALIATGKSPTPKAGGGKSQASPKKVAQKIIQVLEAIPPDHRDRTTVFSELYEYITKAWREIKGTKHGEEIAEKEPEDCDEEESDADVDVDETEDEECDEVESENGYEDEDCSYNLPRA